MKKLFIIIPVILCLSSTSFSRIQSRHVMIASDNYLITSRLDSINIKADELNRLIRQQ